MERRNTYQYLETFERLLYVTQSFQIEIDSNALLQIFFHLNRLYLLALLYSICQLRCHLCCVCVCVCVCMAGDSLTLSRSHMWTSTLSPLGRDPRAPCPLPWRTSTATSLRRLPRSSCRTTRPGTCTSPLTTTRPRSCMPGNYWTSLLMGILVILSSTKTSPHFLKYTKTTLTGNNFHYY